MRNFKTTSGGHLRERLLSFSDLDRRFTYNIIVSPMPIANYVATFGLKPITADNRTFVEWMAELMLRPKTSRVSVNRSGRTHSQPKSLRSKRRLLARRR